MPTTFAITIDGNELYAKRAEQDKDGNQIDTTYAKTSDIPTDVVPAVTSSDDGKVLKASYSGGQGSYSWQNESGGGGSSGFTIYKSNNAPSNDAENIAAFVKANIANGPIAAEFTASNGDKEVYTVVFYRAQNLKGISGDYPEFHLFGCSSSDKATKIYYYYPYDNGTEIHYTYIETENDPLYSGETLINYGYLDYWDGYRFESISNNDTENRSNDLKISIYPINLSAADAANIFGSNYSDIDGWIFVYPASIIRNSNMEVEKVFFANVVPSYDNKKNYLVRVDLEFGNGPHSAPTSKSINVTEAGGGGTQVQADWNESDSSAPSYIQNKPSIPEQWSTTTTAISVSGSGESRRFNITGTEVKRYTCSTFNQNSMQSCYIKEDADAMKHDWELRASVSSSASIVNVKIYNSSNILNTDYFMFTIMSISSSSSSPAGIYGHSMTGEINITADKAYSSRKVMIKKVGRTIMCLWAD